MPYNNHFIVTFAFIWVRAFMDDYLTELPVIGSKERHVIEQKNVWTGITSAILFMCSFAYLKPYLEYEQSQFM